MKKLTRIALCLICSFNFVFAQKVNFKINAPDNVKLGEEITYEVEVDKNEIAGFARLQIDFPEGFVVSVKQAHGASFSFKDGKARFLWMSLPGESKLTVSCVVKSDNAGQYKIEGVFSYVLNNETLRSDLPVFNMNVGTGAALLAEIPKEEVSKKTEPEKKSRKDPETLETERKAREEASLKSKEEEKKEAERMRKETTDKAVEINVKKEVHKQEVKAEEGYSANNETKSETTVPEIKEEKIVEETKASQIDDKKQDDSKITEHKQLVSLNDKNNDIAIEEERKAKEIAEEKARNERLLREKVEADRLAREKIEAERKAKIEADKKMVTEPEKPVYSQNQAQTRPTSYTSLSNSKADFRVQVGASREPAAVGEYRRLEKNFAEYQVVQNVGTDGWYRYTIGSFSKVEDAKQLHSKVAAMGFDSFVVAFKDGQRTSIAEAKRIIGQ